MTVDEARAEFKRVFLVFPSYLEWLERRESGSETLEAWCNLLVKCDTSDVHDVVTRICEGDLDPVGRFDKPDSLPRTIKHEANERRSQRIERRRQSRYHDQVRGTWGDVARTAYGHVAIQLGEMVRRGEITPEENTKRMAEAWEWDRGGKEPAWLPAVLGRKPRKPVEKQGFYRETRRHLLID